MSTVKIAVAGGMAYVESMPPGVEVQITDYNVDRSSPEHDESGIPCARWTVTEEDLALAKAA